MGWMLHKKATAGYGLALAIGIAISFATYRNTLKFIDASHWVSHTHSVLDELDQTLVTMDEAEASTRGYLLTGDESYLTPYHGAASHIDGHLHRLRTSPLMTLTNSVTFRAWVVSLRETRIS